MTVHYVITETLYRSNKRFRKVTSSFLHATSINLWRGSVWEVRDGKRKLIKRVYN